MLEITDISSKRRLRKKLHLKAKSVQMLAFVNQLKLMFPESGTGNGICPRCSEEFTYEQIKSIFVRLRRSEQYNLNILNGENCNINNSDKTLERLTEEFNKTTKKYKINECIQKIHFIAQIYWESDRLKTGLKYAS